MKRFISFSSAILFSLTHAPFVSAAADDGVANFSHIDTIVERLITAVGAFAGVGLFIALIMGGMTFLFSGGDAKKLEKGKNAITYAVIGIVVIAGSWLIISLLGKFTGVNLQNFSISGSGE